MSLFCHYFVTFQHSRSMLRYIKHQRIVASHVDQSPRTILLLNPLAPSLHGLIVDNVVRRKSMPGNPIVYLPIIAQKNRGAHLRKCGRIVPFVDPFPVFPSKGNQHVFASTLDNRKGTCTTAEVSIRVHPTRNLPTAPTASIQIIGNSLRNVLNTLCGNAVCIPICSCKKHSKQQHQQDETRFFHAHPPFLFSQFSVSLLTL